MSDVVQPSAKTNLTEGHDFRLGRVTPRATTNLPEGQVPEAALPSSTGQKSVCTREQPLKDSERNRGNRNVPKPTKQFTESDSVPRPVEGIRRKVKIAALNSGSLNSREGFARGYIHDNEANVVVESE